MRYAQKLYAGPISDWWYRLEQQKTTKLVFEQVIQLSSHDQLKAAFRMGSLQTLSITELSFDVLWHTFHSFNLLNTKIHKAIKCPFYGP